jgi:hypothetical protein
MTAIDRSTKMTTAAAKRNAAWIESGVATVQTASLHEADFGGALFDKVFGIHFPPLMRGKPSRELEVVRRCLAPGGSLDVIFQPFARDEIAPTVARVTSILEAAGFRVEGVGMADATPVSVVSVVGRP